ncbi:WD40 repeat-like protein [Suillus decipiens]|nr:WD40 repeat-like protein [Suillus decipiens]
MVSTKTWAELFHKEMILTPVEMSDEYYQSDDFTSIAYFLDGKQLFSGSSDKITRRWDLESGKEIEKARDVCEEEITAVAVSRDGRWVVTGGRRGKRPELKACEVETGIVKRFEGHSRSIICIDISADSTLLASGSHDSTARIWNLETGKLVAGPFKSIDHVGAVRFSPDSKKLAVKSTVGRCLEVWDVQSQKLGVRIGQSSEDGSADAPVFWINQNQNILTAFSFDGDYATTIYEFDASTLKTVGTPFKGQTQIVMSLALLFNGALLVGAYNNATINLWAFESRQLLSSYSLGSAVVHTLMPSPDSLRLAYTTYGDPDIYVFDVTPALLSIQSTLHKTHTNLLNSDATRRPVAVRRTPAKRPVIVSSPRHQIHPSTTDHQQPVFLRHVRKLFHFSSRTSSVPPVQPRDPWDVRLFISFF